MEYKEKKKSKRSKMFIFAIHGEDELYEDASQNTRFNLTRSACHALCSIVVAQSAPSWLAG